MKKNIKQEVLGYQAKFQNEVRASRSYTIYLSLIKSIDKFCYENNASRSDLMNYVLIKFFENEKQ